VTASEIYITGLTPLVAQYKNFNDRGLMSTYLSMPAHSALLNEKGFLEKISLRAKQWQMQYSRADRLQLAALSADIQIDWLEEQSFSLSLGATVIGADTALLKLKGRFEVAANGIMFVPTEDLSILLAQNINIEQPTTEGLFEIHADDVQFDGQLNFDFATDDLPADSSSKTNAFNLSGKFKLATLLVKPPVASGSPYQSIKVAETSANLELQLKQGQLLSHGKGNLRGFSLENYSTAQLNVTANELSLDWRKFNV
jgi:hypothetical protein